MQQSGGRTWYIIPAAVGLKNLKAKLGATAFDALFTDGLHLNAKGTYFVSLICFSVLYKKSPVGAVNVSNTGLTSTEDSTYKTTAWDTVNAYAY